MPAKSRFGLSRNAHSLGRAPIRLHIGPNLNVPPSEADILRPDEVSTQVFASPLQRAPAAIFTDTLTPTNPGVLGSGFNTITGESRSLALTLGAADVGETLLRVMDCRILRVESYSALLDTLRVTAKASATFGSLKSNAKAEFARTLHFHQYSVFMVVKVSIFLKRLDVLHPIPTANALTLLKARRGGQQFLQQYGDAFCRTAFLGGELFGVVQFQTRTHEEYEYLAGKLDAVGGPIADFEFKTEMERRLSSLEHSSTLQIDLYRSGVISSIPKYDSFLDYVLRFPDEIATTERNPAVAETDSADYGAMERPPNVSVPDLNAQYAVLVSLANARNRAEELREVYTYVARYPFEFADPPDVMRRSAEEAVLELETAIEAIDAQAAGLQKDYLSVPANVRIPDLRKFEPVPRRRPGLQLPFEVHALFAGTADEQRGIGGSELSGGKLYALGIFSNEPEIEVWVQFAVYVQPTGRPRPRDGRRLEPESLANAYIKYNQHIGSGIYWEMICGMRIFLKGARASRYSAQYSLKMVDGRTFSGADGEWAGDYAPGPTDGYRTNISKIRVDIVSKI